MFSALSPAQCWSLQLPRPRDLFVFVSNETLQEPGNLHTGNVCCLFGVPTPQAIHPLIHMYISFSIHMYLYMIIYIYIEMYIDTYVYNAHKIKKSILDVWTIYLDLLSDAAQPGPSRV